MIRILIRKLLQGVLMVLIVSALAFFLLAAAGGDALTSLSENPQVSAETVERLRAVYGFDRPVLERFFGWLGRAVRGDLGESFIYRLPVADLVLSRLANTVLLGSAAMIFAILVAGALTYLAVLTRSRKISLLLELTVALVGSTPRIVAALLALLALVTLTAARIGTGSRSPLVLAVAAMVVSMPILAILLAQSSYQLRRASDLTFVQLARAKGLSEGKVIARHALREALNPILTVLGLSLGSLIGGSVVVETILGWPGIGELTVAAVRGRDVSLIMGIVVVTTAAVWLGNSLAEMMQLVNDPRIRQAEVAPET